MDTNFVGNNCGFRWRFEHAKCVPLHLNGSAEGNEPVQCQKVCSEFTSCLNCTQEECIWCQNEGRCVDKVRKNCKTAVFFVVIIIRDFSQSVQFQMAEKKSTVPEIYNRVTYQQKDVTTL